MVTIKYKKLNMHYIIFLLLIISSEAFSQKSLDSLFNEIDKEEDNYIKRRSKEIPKNTKYLIISKNKKNSEIYNYTKTRFLYIDGIPKFTLTKELNKLTDLELLVTLTDTKVKISKEIKPFPKLMVLTIFSYHSAEHNFVSGCINLRSLIMAARNEEFLSSLCNLKLLEELRIYFDKRIKYIPDCIYNMKNLRILIILHDSKRTLHLSKNIIKLKKLDSLWLPIELNKKNIEILSQMKQLNTLIVSSIQLSDYDELKKLYFLKFLIIKEPRKKTNFYKIQNNLPSTRVRKRW